MVCANSKWREEKLDMTVSSPVRNITPPVTGPQKARRILQLRTYFSLGHAVGSYAKGELLQRRGTIMRVR
jgi:hypothetical protein